MTLGYKRVSSIPDLGGFVYGVPLSPAMRLFDANDVCLGVVDELSIVTTQQASTGTPTFRLPPITSHGQMVGVKNINPGADGAILISILPSGSDIMFAGIGAQQLNSCVFTGNAGEAAVFVSAFDADTIAGLGFPAWFLMCYLTGSTFAP